jgi:eukaryotic-like serine/threonine-protein kinase
VHSNIVPVFDFGRAGDEFFLALEYVHGRDLEKLTQKHLAATQRGLPPPVVFFVMHEVLEGLAYAHNRTGTSGEPLEIVHRDISPANVLISFIGEVKLSDFGIVKAAGRVSKTDERVVKGNVNFMSPEQARGESVDSRSDLFSAGVVMFYCLTGRLLYSGESTFNQLIRAAVGPVTEQFRQIQDLPPEAGAILDRALAQDPARRFQTAAEFARAIRPLVGGGEADLVQMMATYYAEEMKVDF